jgi:hypothetical protein
MSSSIKRKNHWSVASSSTERSRRHHEKQCKNQQTNHDASIAKAQPRLIPLTHAEQQRLHRALKRQNQLNDAEAQNRSVPLLVTERKRREREAKRKNRVHFAYT